MSLSIKEKRERGREEKASEGLKKCSG